MQTRLNTLKYIKKVELRIEEGNMKKIVVTGLLIIFLVALIFSQNNPSQQPWTLQQCIDYAIKNNIQIKQQEISAGISKEDLIRNKAQVLPNLNGNQSNDFSYGRNFDVGSGRLTTKETFSQSFGLSANLTIFSGLQTYNNILQSRYGYEAGKMDVDKMKNDIALNVATAYLQVLFNMENFELAKVQTAITGSQVKRITIMVEVGAMAKSNLLDIAAQLASDEYAATTAKNNEHARALLTELGMPFRK